MMAGGRERGAVIEGGRGREGETKGRREGGREEGVHLASPTPAPARTLVGQLLIVSCLSLLNQLLIISESAAYHH